MSLVTSSYLTSEQEDDSLVVPSIEMSYRESKLNSNSKQEITQNTDRSCGAKPVVGTMPPFNSEALNSHVSPPKEEEHEGGPSCMTIIPEDEHDLQESTKTFNQNSKSLLHNKTKSGLETVFTQQTFDY